MSHQCHDESCSTSHGGHSHHHGFSGGCGCCCHSQQQSSCCGGGGAHGYQECCDKAHKFLELADEAWMEVLKEKIMDHIRSSDSKIEELAKIVSETNRLRWQSKLAKLKNCEEYERKLNELMGQCCSSSNEGQKKR